MSLGCAKNLVDAEIMLGSLLQQGVEIVNDPAQADALIVNTCSFIDAAQEESVDTILESAAVRDARHRGQALIVSGCLPQRFRDELPRLLPEVDAFMGVDQVAEVGRIVDDALARRAEKAPLRPASSARSRRVKDELARLDRQPTTTSPQAGESLRGSDKFGRTKTVVTPGAQVGPVVEVHRRPEFIPNWETPRYRLTPRHFAYVKIAEGCNHPCSFCIIPRMRGHHRSRPPADIVEEARRLLADGVRELNLISQDTTYYGLDLHPRHRPNIASPARFSAAKNALPADAPTLSALLRALNALEGDFWIRLLYTHPAHWTDDLIEAIAACPKVARYVDMPLQHIHDAMLERMRRETSGQYIHDLIARLRAGIPGIALRTTFIVGFPGETEAYFETLLDFIRNTRFERLGVFTYSQEEGTVAGRMVNQVPEKERRRRRDLAMAAQRGVAREVSARQVGQTLRVLVENSADPRQLDEARVSSWEHGLIRESAANQPHLRRGPWMVARGEADAPDIDGRVYVRGRLPAGEFARVRVIGHTDYDLIAEPV
ncbi:MAG: 30S ribosomal protein S12 methylthiotransferase RimO [Verrucomicrobia bacterium]|nr:30S ribosomal protein S12 methylthiotransferase RimO [Verrucomicrobiota bacterium]